MKPVLAWRRARRKLLTPALREVDPQRRGFYAWESGTDMVRPVGRAFLVGYGIAAHEPTARRAIERAQNLPPAWRGFAMEGAAMATAIRACVTPIRRREFDRFMTYCQDRHSYMSYVGLGWALARLPRPLWPRLDSYDPLIRPLILDGYGFHEVFFHTDQVLTRHAVDFPTRKWPGGPGEATPALMQGVGRGMWFVAGGNVQILSGLIDGFAADAHASLWAGAGLAAAYAGGRDEGVLIDMLHYAGPHRRWVSQGAAFAIEARLRADTITAHTLEAAKVFCRSEPLEVAARVASVRPAAALVDSGRPGSYEKWRHDVAATFADD